MSRELRRLLPITSEGSEEKGKKLPLHQIMGAAPGPLPVPSVKKLMRELELDEKPWPPIKLDQNLYVVNVRENQELYQAYRFLQISLVPIEILEREEVKKLIAKAALAETYDEPLEPLAQEEPEEADDPDNF